MFLYKNYYVYLIATKINKKIQNKRAQQWIDNELKLRNITKFKKITA